MIATSNFTGARIPTHEPGSAAATYVAACENLGCKKNSSLLRLFPSTLSGYDSLSEIDLQHNLVGRTGVYAVLEVIKLSHSLTKISFANNGLDEAAIQALAKCLKKQHQSLAELDLSFNPMRRPAGKSILKIINNVESLRDVSVEETLIPSSTKKKIRIALADRQLRNSISIKDADLDHMIDDMKHEIEEKYHHHNTYQLPTDVDPNPGDGLPFISKEVSAEVQHVKEMEQEAHDKAQLNTFVWDAKHVRHLLKDDTMFQAMVRTIFRHASRLRRPVITRSQAHGALCSLATQIGIANPSLEHVTQLCVKLDSDHSGQLNEEEFSEVLKTFLKEELPAIEANNQSKGPSSEAIAQFYHSLASAADGILTIKELKAVFKEYQMAMSSVEGAGKAFSFADQNHDRGLTCDEFITFYKMLPGDPFKLRHKS